MPPYLLALEGLFDNGVILANHCVQITDEIIREIVHQSTAPSDARTVDGILSPGFLISKSTEMAGCCSIVAFRLQAKYLLPTKNLQLRGYYLRSSRIIQMFWQGFAVKKVFLLCAAVRILQKVYITVDQKNFLRQASGAYRAILRAKLPHQK